MRALLRRALPAALRGRLSRAPKHLAVNLRRCWMIRLRPRPIEDLTIFEKRIHSQNGEDGILDAIFAAIGATDHYFVEFGVEDGNVCNTRRLRERGWRGLWMDPREPPAPGVQREFATAENIELLLDKYRVPREFDLLSIDVDGNDYWIWKAIERRPRVVVIEYNAAIPPGERRAIRYDPAFRWDGTEYFGAGLGALEALGREKGYALIACDSRGVNAFFVRRELAEGRFLPRSAEAVYRPLGAPHPPPPPAPGREWARV